MFSRLVMTTVLLLASAVGSEARPNQTTIVCVNPASGTAWPVHIDFGHATVDGFAAQIDVAQISWHDGKDGGNYTLERKTGELTAVFASSTGGYFMHYRCSGPGTH